MTLNGFLIRDIIYKKIILISEQFI